MSRRFETGTAVQLSIFDDAGATGRGAEWQLQHDNKYAYKCTLDGEVQERITREAAAVQ